MQHQIIIALLMLTAATVPARADRIVAVAPLSTLGAEDKSTATKKLTTQIEQAIAALPGTKVVPAQQVLDAIGKAKKPQLKVCEGDATCVAEVGKLVGAQLVVTGEVGGLGTSQVVYLNATDVASSKEIRSTTLSIGTQEDGGGPTGAAVRLLDPDKYRGTVHFAIDVNNASVFVNGAKSQLSAKGDLQLPVGTQAVRVTHPEYHDFVKFVDVAYGKTTDVPVGMQQYPMVEQDLKSRPTNRDHYEYIDPPVWRRWYVVAPAAVALAVIAGIITYSQREQLSGTCRFVGGGDCTP
ncbi:MAG: hypothetical protein JWO36_3544 [Myxococcales bacterium]|nr:hypothetical protein [Myxococcales bacterium]